MVARRKVCKTFDLPLEPFSCDGRYRPISDGVHAEWWLCGSFAASCKGERSRSRMIAGQRDSGS
jgi:hypothetical protein